MNNNQLVIIVIAILVAGGIVGGALYFSIPKQPTEIANETVNNTTNLTEDVSNTNNTESNDGYEYITDQNGYQYKIKDGKIYNLDGSGGQYFTENDQKVMNGEMEDPRVYGG